MRVVLVIACAAAFVFSVWSNMPTSADAKQAGEFTVNPVSMMSTVTNLPNEQFDTY
jgi:hypothetical protein